MAITFRSSGITFSAGTPVVIGNLSDMSLLQNVAGQNFTFGLIKVTDDLPLIGLGSGVTVRTSADGGPQVTGSGAVTELGNGIYNYSPSQAETNGNCVSFLMTAPASNALPENLMFLTGGLHKNIPGQHITACMFSTSGIADPSASVSVIVSKDGGAQSTGLGIVTNLGNGQYDYALTQAESNGINVNFLFQATGDVIQNLSVFTIP